MEVVFFSANGPGRKKPNLIVHLDVSPEESLRRIHMRKRGCESTITVEYLRNLQQAYEEFLTEIARIIPVIRVNYEEFHTADEMTDVIIRWTHYTQTTSLYIGYNKGTEGDYAVLQHILCTVTDCYNVFCAFTHTSSIGSTHRCVLCAMSTSNQLKRSSRPAHLVQLLCRCDEHPERVNTRHLSIWFGSCKHINTGLIKRYFCTMQL